MKNQSPLFADIPSVFTNNKINTLLNEHLVDKIIDSFNQQTQLNNQFKLRIEKMIDSIEYAYPNEGIKLKKLVELFLDRSMNLLAEQMKKLLDCHVENNAKNGRMPHTNLESNILELTPKHNENWMKDWMEQTDNYKNNPKVLALIANNIEGFLHYADVVEK